jgi:4-carboxymuconolactone decarboxylase
MSDSELREKGLAMRQELFGEAFTRSMNDATYSDPMMQEFRDLVAETVFGALWTRPGIDLKTRTLVCVVCDVATAREQELALHLRMALRQGWTEEELTEVILHLLGYLGAPLVRGAMLCASGVFKAVREEAAACQ